MGLEPTTLRFQVWCSTNWASRAWWMLSGNCWIHTLWCTKVQLLHYILKNNHFGIVLVIWYVYSFYVFTPLDTCIWSNIETVLSWTCHVSGIWIMNIHRYFLFALDTIYVNLPAKILLKIQTVRGFVKILSIPDEELFTKRPSGVLLHTLSKVYDVPVGSISPHTYLRQCIVLFAVAECCLLFVVFDLSCSCVL